MTSYPTGMGWWQPPVIFSRNFHAFAAILLSVSVFAGCNLRPGPLESPTSEQNATSGPFAENAPPCSPSSELPNLALADISAEALAYLEQYSIPTANETELCRYLEQLQQEHETKIEAGLIDMMGDYFWTTQTVETNYYFSYQLSGRSEATPQIILDRASSEEEMVEHFVKAIDDDPDLKRKALFDDFIQELASPGTLSRTEGVRTLMNAIFEQSWIFNSDFQQSARNADRDDTYNFADRGLRTTTPIIIAALVDRFLNSETGKESLPDEISRILIIGPGLQFSDPDMGQAIPQQSHEPFTLMDSLLRSGKASFEDLRIDLLDINPRVVEHFEDAIDDAAGSGDPYVTHVVMNTEEDRDRVHLGVFDYGRTVFGLSLPGAESGMPLEENSLRPASGTLEPAEVLFRTVQIPANIVEKLHPFQGDMTTTDLEKIALADGDHYDVVFCFNTLVYLNETERMLAGINIRKALAENGVFVTDNRFETETGERPGRIESAVIAAVPIFDASFFEMVADYNEDGTNMGPAENEGRRTIVYRRPRSGNRNN